MWNNINFFDTECRLEGELTNWFRIKKLLEDEVFYKNNVTNSDYEALFYYKKKKFWLNVEFLNIELRILSIKGERKEIVQARICEAKEWILDAPPIYWDEMLFCFKNALKIYSLSKALQQAMKVYKTLKQ